MKDKTDFSYQEDAISKVLENAYNSNYIASVLAACPSSGKTTISHGIINRYLKQYPDAKVLVLTEGQNALKNQYLEELKTPNIPINFTFGSFQSNAQVRVGIPQNIHKLDWGKIDLLIVDECHNWYLERTDREIIARLQPKHQIIMTGSPTKFNRYNKAHNRKYAMYYISAEELQKKGVFSGVDLDIVKVSYKKNSINTIKQVLEYMALNKYNTDKLMIACPTIAYANEIAQYLSLMKRSVSLSTSKNDPNNEQIQRFKDGGTDTLVVVDKGILGFNDKKITTLIDFKTSNNVDASYQLFARVLRTHPKGIRKVYLRVTDKIKYNNNVIMLHKMITMMKTKFFKGFTGKNLTMEVKRNDKILDILSEI